MQIIIRELQYGHAFSILIIYKYIYTKYQCRTKGILITLERPQGGILKFFVCFCLFEFRNVRDTRRIIIFNEENCRIVIFGQSIEFNQKCVSEFQNR